jgi:hypothetical protein
VEGEDGMGEIDSGVRSGERAQVLPFFKRSSSACNAWLCTTTSSGLKVRLVSLGTHSVKRITGGGLSVRGRRVGCLKGEGDQLDFGLVARLIGGGERGLPVEVEGQRGLWILRGSLE